jgi:hypothetical protein
MRLDDPLHDRNLGDARGRDVEIGECRSSSGL